MRYETLLMTPEVKAMKHAPHCKVTSMFEAKKLGSCSLGNQNLAQGLTRLGELKVSPPSRSLKRRLRSLR